MASFDQTVRSQMLAMINLDKGMVLTPADVTFGIPTLVDATVDNLNDPAKRNSSVQITTAPNAGVRLTANVAYNRLKLPSLFALSGPQLTYGNELTSRDLITKINTHLATQLIAADIDDLPVTVSGSDHVVTLRAATTSLVCFGEIVLTLVTEDTGPVDPSAPWTPGILINANVEPEEFFLSQWPTDGEIMLVGGRQGHWHVNSSADLLIALKMESDRGDGHVIPTTEGGKQVYAVTLEEYGDISPGMFPEALIGSRVDPLFDNYEVRFTGAPNIPGSNGLGVDIGFEFNPTPNFLYPEANLDPHPQFVWDAAQGGYVVDITTGLTEVFLRSTAAQAHGLPAGEGFRFQVKLLQAPEGAVLNYSSKLDALNLQFDEVSAIGRFGSDHWFPSNVIPDGGDLELRFYNTSGTLQGFKFLVYIPPYVVADVLVLDDDSPIMGVFGINENDAPLRKFGIWGDLTMWGDNIRSEAVLEVDGNGTYYGEWEIKLSARHLTTNVVTEVPITMRGLGAWETVAERFSNSEVSVANKPATIPAETSSNVAWLVAENFNQTLVAKAYPTGGGGATGGGNSLPEVRGCNFQFYVDGEDSWFITFGIEDKTNTIPPMTDTVGDEVIVEMRELTTPNPDNTGYYEHGLLRHFKITRNMVNDEITAQLVEGGNTWNLTTMGLADYSGENDSVAFSLNMAMIRTAFPAMVDVANASTGTWRVVLKRMIDGEVYSKLPFIVEAWADLTPDTGGGGPWAPTSDDSIPVGVTETLNVTLDAPFVDGDTNLLTNDYYASPANNGSFYVQETSEFKVALRAYDDYNWIADSDGTRVYNMTDGIYENFSHWNFAVALEAIGKADILTDYEVWLTLHETSNVANVPTHFQLTDIGGGAMAFTNADGSFPAGYASGNVLITDNWVQQYAGEIDGAPKTSEVHVPTGTFRVLVTVKRKSDDTVIIHAPITAYAPNSGINYPWQHYDFGLTLDNPGSGFVDSSNLLLSDGVSSAEHFMLSEHEIVRLGLRAAPDPLAPLAPITNPDGWAHNKDLYLFENLAADGNEWYVDVCVDVGTTEQRDSTMTGVANKIRLWLTGTDSPSSNTLVVPWTIRWNGGNWAIHHDNNVIPDFNPTWVSSDGTKFILRIRAADVAIRFSSSYKDTSGMLSKVGVVLEFLSNDQTTYFGSASIKVKAYDGLAP